MSRFSLEGRVALVTGAGRGIGKALALGLAQDGADLVCVARTGAEVEATAALAREMGRRAIAVTADITDRSQVDAAVAAAVEQLGRIDILVNNAGMNIRTPAIDLPEQDWDTVVDTNLKGPFLVAQAVGRQMREQGYGRIINIASVGGGVALRTGVAYGSSKAGLIHMTRILALEWAKYGITVNAVGPWYFKTSLTEKLLANEQYLSEILARTPLKRVGELEELVGPVVFFASGASSYVTGQVLYVDGGMTIYGF
ncbi:MAG: putative gluconate dehydrogenase [Symbiobacteriaceae bacterium]|jgi:NAD(P)-dependent dehydrogenase (short-subunit alcohol dehydrogenase family)|nr:putative gluconate dehydrogenase [Symbiobacteriaceae bacterium]